MSDDVHRCIAITYSWWQGFREGKIFFIHCMRKFDSKSKQEAKLAKNGSIRLILIYIKFSSRYYKSQTRWEGPIVTKIHYWIFLRFCFFWSSSTFKIKDHAIPIVKSKRSDKKTCVKFHETNSKNTWAHTNGNALKWGTSYINWFFPNLLLCDTFL